MWTALCITKEVLDYLSWNKFTRQVGHDLGSNPDGNIKLLKPLSLILLMIILFNQPTKIVFSDKPST